MLRRCFDCKQEKAIDAFILRKTDKTGRGHCCQTCANERSKHYRQANRDKSRACVRNSIYKSRYGLTLTQIEDLKAGQAYKCAVCGRDDKRLVVDHCHATGAIRGVLCNNCNVALGQVADNVDILTKLIVYVERNTTNGNSCGLRLHREGQVDASLV